MMQKIDVKQCIIIRNFIHSSFITSSIINIKNVGIECGSLLEIKTEKCFCIKNRYLQTCTNKKVLEFQLAICLVYSRR